MDFLVHHMLRTSARSFPKKEALVDGNQRMTYEDVWFKTSAIAQGLRKAGVKRGDRIGIFMEPSINQVLSIFGISQAGGVFIPIHHSLFSEQVAHIVKDCGMKGLITEKPKIDKLSSVLTDSPPLEFLVQAEPGEPPDLPIATYTVGGFFEQAHPQSCDDVAIEKDLAAILYTSGSTGKPKGVMLSHMNIMAGAKIVSNYLSITASDRTLAALPFSFDAGLNQLMTAFLQGGTLVLINFLFANEILSVLEKERITALAGVPTLWSLIAHSPRLQKTEFPDLRYITNTGGVMPKSVLQILRDRLCKTNIFLMYGLTEAFRSTYLPPEELERRPSSMGKAIPNTDILVINDRGEQCKPGEVGELVHHGPTVSLGYWGQPELSAQVLRPHPFLSEGLREHHKVCYSGDLVRMDEEGFLYFVGRRDNLIKSSGFRISPAEVEEIICQSEMVQDAAVIGVPDEVAGQRIKAFVVAKNGKLDPADLLAFCASRMPNYMAPKSVEILEALPKTTSGKVDYPELRRREELESRNE